jgi:dipeptidase D
VSDAIAGLKPELLWKYFAAISRIPRGSKNEAAITKYVLGVARQLGLEARADKVGNVVARKPASPGREHVRTVVLQGHLDMVCEKNKDTVHDFLKDPLVLVRKGDVLMADGTTLGADNGVAVATNLAIMEDKSLEHGPLEFLFTVDEETGLTGANALGGDLLAGRTLLNLDSEEEGALYVGCSGGRNTTARWALATDAAPATLTAGVLKVTGLRGGHSGLEIDKNRGNSIKIIARVLYALSELGVRMGSIEGGDKHNAIPREAEALVFVPKKAWPVAAELVARCQATLRTELGSADPGLHLTLTEAKGARRRAAFKKAVQMKLLHTLIALPHGVIKMSTDIPGLVETSTNVASIKSSAKAIDMVLSQRSSVASEIDEICDTVRVILELGGAKVKQGDGYPGWKPNLDSEVLRVAKNTYKQLYGKTPEVKAIHAGLECGIIGEKYSGMDMLSFGPTLEGVHSPDEKIYIGTVEKYWNFLLGILKNIG